MWKGTHTHLHHPALAFQESIFHHGTDLLLNETRRSDVHILHALRVLRSQGRRGRHSKASMCGECLLIGLKATG